MMNIYKVIFEVDFTFGVEEPGLPAVVNHFLLTVFGALYNGLKLLRGGAVVEIHNVRF